MATTSENPVAEQFPKENITDQTTLETIVKYQSDVENIDQIHFDRLYKLDMGKLGLYNIENEYFMDIETRMVFINNGIEISSGMIYIIEEMEIYPVSLEVQEGEEGFILVAKADEENRQINSYDFYIDNELYKTVVTTQNTAEIEVRDKEFGEYQCYVRVNRSNGQNDKSIEVTAENYYVKNKADMEIFRDRVNSGNNFAGKTIKLLSDIDLQGSESSQWTPIGTMQIAFEGTFQGNEHKISNIYINNNQPNQGLFGVSSGHILDLNLYGSIASTAENIGGIVGNNSGTIKSCDNHSNITGNYYVGGISGYVHNGSVINCNNTGEISGLGADTDAISRIGGVVGLKNGTGSIESCNNSGTISGETQIGGIVGGNDGDILNCINNGIVNGSVQYAGGIVGTSGSGTITKCFNYAKTSGKYYIGGIAGTQGNSESGSSITKCSNNSTIIGEYAVGGIS